jgi:hypothetical protein
MNKVLLAEDGKTFGSLSRRSLGGDGRFDVDWAPSLAEAEALLQDAKAPCLGALLDVHLPDGPNGEVAGVAGHFGKRHVAARVGGEEFAVACTEVAHQELLDSFEELRKKVEALLRVSTPAGEVACTISIGLCLDPGESLHEMVGTADRLLHECKKAGRNRVLWQGGRAGLRLPGDGR